MTLLGSEGENLICVDDVIVVVGDVLMLLLRVLLLLLLRVLLLLLGDADKEGRWIIDGY